MDGFHFNGNSTNGSLVSTLLQLSSQVDFMDQFLSMVHPAEYTHLKNLVSNNQQRIAAVILQSPVTMVTPPSAGTSAISSSVNHFEHNLNTTTNGMCNGSSSSLVQQLASNIVTATGNNQVLNSLPVAPDGSLLPPVVKKRRGRKRKCPLVEENNAGNVASASNSNLQLGIGNRAVNDQAALYYLQPKGDQVWVPVTTTTTSVNVNNAGASKTESNCQQNEVSNSCSISSSSQSTPTTTTTEITGLELLLAAVSNAIQTQNPTNAPVSTSTPVSALISNSENIPDNLNNSNHCLLEYALKQSGISHEEVQGKRQRIEIAEMETSSQENFQRNLNEEGAHLQQDCEHLIMSKELNQPGSLLQSPSPIRSLECSTTIDMNDMSPEEYRILVSNPDHEILV